MSKKTDVPPRVKEKREVNRVKGILEKKHQSE